MPQNVATEMLLVTSDDYWGHAGDFDSAVNFYPYSFIVTPEQYSGMDDADKSRFYPCALFYYMGETDNHGYRPQRIGTRVEVLGIEITVGTVCNFNQFETVVRGFFRNRDVYGEICSNILIGNYRTVLRF